MFEVRALSPWAQRRRDGEVSVALATLGADFSLLEDSDLQIGVDAFKPQIARQKNVLIWRLPSGRSLRCLLDSGAELNLLDSSVVARGDPGVLGTDEIIEWEPHNPLLDVVDDPSVPDLTAEEAQVELEATLKEFSNVFVDSLPMERLPPFRPVNHTIPLLDNC
jgi:hypothetical protein